MRVLLDENVPHELAPALTGHEVSNVQAEGWNGKRNGELLQLAGERFDALVSMDRGLAHQQNLSRVRLRMVIVRAPSNRIEDVRPLAGLIVTTLAGMRPGQLEVVRTPGWVGKDRAKPPATPPGEAGETAAQTPVQGRDDETPSR